MSFVVRQPSSFCFQACIYRRKHGETEIFADNITLIIQDGGSNQISTINLQNNAGYNAKLLLVDFSKDNIFDILVSIDSRGSGGYDISIFIPSGQGVYYTHPEFQTRVELGLNQSMFRRKGNCWNNARMESFFAHFKDEVDYLEVKLLISYND
ncbi:hypothetical protein ABGT24_20830 [Peribacillus frigoritolerans]